MRRTLFALLVATGLLLTALNAAAESKASIQVLAIGSEDAYEQAQALTIALKRAITRTEGWSLTKGDFSLEVLTAAMGCPLPPDPGCQKKIAAKVGTNRYIWGTLAKKGKKDVVAALRLWEDGEQKKDTEITYSANLTDPSDDTLLAVAGDAFARLTGEATGVVVVTAGNLNAKVFVDGEEVGTLTDGRTELTLPSGDHKVMVRADGYNDAVGTVTVRAGASAEVALAPTVKTADSNGDVTKDKGGGSSKLLGYIGVGVGGAMVVAGAYFGIQNLSKRNADELKTYRETTVPKGDTACSFAESRSDAESQKVVDICNEAKRDQTLFWVLTPAGAVITGVGVYLLMTANDKPEAAKRPRVMPIAAVGPHGGQLWMNVTF
jgi:hypothetical protein